MSLSFGEADGIHRSLWMASSLRPVTHERKQFTRQHTTVDNYRESRIIEEVGIRRLRTYLKSSGGKISIWLRIG